MVTWRIEALASPRQIDEILTIEEASFTNPWTREMYLADLDNRGVSYCFTAQGEDGHIVGFCSVWRVADEIHITNVAVQVLGARGLDDDRLLYERFGFVVAGIRRGYYTKPIEDALVLWRESLKRDK